jgi:hypothetical protein
MQTKTITKRFYKEGKIWYIDLPEFLDEGLGTKANLIMVDGSDALLDILSKNGKEVTIEFSQLPAEQSWPEWQCVWQHYHSHRHLDWQHHIRHCVNLQRWQW